MTDIHLNFLSRSRIENFCRKIRNASADAILIAGDIGEAPSVEGYLRYLEDYLQLPIFFVLGNHDYYQGSIAGMRKSVLKLCRESRLLHWLTAERVIELATATGLVGHDSWADGRLGEGMGSNMVLNDFFLIEELALLSRTARFSLLNRMGDEAAAHFERVLPEAFARFQSVILLTHVPPFRESCWYEGQISDDSALPHFSCKAVGDVLLREMSSPTTLPNGMAAAGRLSVQEWMTKS